MRLFSIIAILFFLSSCQSTGPAHSPYDHCVRNKLGLMPEPPDNESVLLVQMSCMLKHGNFEFEISSVTLQDDEITRFKQIAVEAATSTVEWSRFGGQRFIEGPFTVDATQIEYLALGIGYRGIFGGKHRGIFGGKMTISGDGKSDRIKVTIPTDVIDPTEPDSLGRWCDRFDVFPPPTNRYIVIEVIVDRESGRVVDMKELLPGCSHLVDPIMISPDIVDYW